MTLVSAPAAPDADVLERLLAERWSCRDYTDEQVAEATIERLLQMARQTPSWCNTQPWNVIVTRGAATEAFRAALIDHATDHVPQPDIPMPKRYTGEHLARRRECGWQLYDAVGIERGDRAASAAQAARNYELFGAPHVAIITSATALGTYGVLDTGLYVSTFLLAAQSLGLGAVPQAALATCSPFLRRWFDIPEDQTIVCGVSFGHPDRGAPSNAFRTSRAPLSQTTRVVHGPSGGSRTI